LPLTPADTKLSAYPRSSAARLAGLPDFDFFLTGGCGFFEDIGPAPIPAGIPMLCAIAGGMPPPLRI
jgi:hypothetical protein